MDQRQQMEQQAYMQRQQSQLQQQRNSQYRQPSPQRKSHAHVVHQVQHQTPQGTYVSQHTHVVPVHQPPEGMTQQIINRQSSSPKQEQRRVVRSSQVNNKPMQQSANDAPQYQIVGGGNSMVYNQPSAQFAPQRSQAQFRGGRTNQQQNRLTSNIQANPNQRHMELVISDETVEKIMGAEPIPQLDIEMSEIQNELQRKMVEEITCVMCGNFPYKPAECKQCNKLFCKYCQLQLQEEAQLNKSQNPQAMVNDFDLTEEQLAKMSPRQQKEYQAQMYEKRQRSADRRSGNAMHSEQYQCCPNCQVRGDFMQDINKVLRNCIDFCEFPHKCYLQQKSGSVIWKTMLDLQEHAMYECPKFGCDICYQEEYQHMTRAQLFQHIKRECPAVMVQCQVCSGEFNRSEFASHVCLKDLFTQKLKKNEFEVLEYLAEHLMMLRRSKEGLGLCMREECVERFKQSQQKQSGQGMIAPNTSNQAQKCERCQTVVPGYEDSFNCIYCGVGFCPSCLGYTKYFDMDELEVVINK